MKVLIIVLLGWSLWFSVGCNHVSEQNEKIPPGYAKDVRSWKVSLPKHPVVADSGKQLMINVIFLENHNYDEERPSYVCLAIDGDVVFDGKVRNTDNSTFVGLVADTVLLEGFALKEGKHVFTVFDVAHGLKVEKEIEIVKDECWVVLSNAGTPQEPIGIQILDQRPIKL